MNFDIRINETQRQIILSALTQSQLHRHYGADLETRTEGDLLVAMFDSLPEDVAKEGECVHDFTM